MNLVSEFWSLSRIVPQKSAGNSIKHTFLAHPFSIMYQVWVTFATATQSSHTLHLFLKWDEVFPGQMGNGIPPGAFCFYLHGGASERNPDHMPKPCLLAPLKCKAAVATLSSFQTPEPPLLFLWLCPDTLWSKFISATCVCGLILLVNTQS